MVKLSPVNSFSREKTNRLGDLEFEWQTKQVKVCFFFLGLEEGNENVTHVNFGCF